MLSPQDQANKLWQTERYYYGNSTLLESTQRVILNICEIVRIFDYKNYEYWNEVKLLIYKK